MFHKKLFNLFTIFVLLLFMLGTLNGIFISFTSPDLTLSPIEEDETRILKYNVGRLATDFSTSYIKFENYTGLFEMINGTTIQLEDYNSDRQNEQMQEITIEYQDRQRKQQQKEKQQANLKKTVDRLFMPFTLILHFLNPLESFDLNTLVQNFASPMTNVLSSTDNFLSTQITQSENEEIISTTLSSDFTSLFDIAETPTPRLRTETVRIDENFDTYMITDPNNYNVSDLSQIEKNSTFAFAFNNTRNYVGFYTYEPDNDFRAGQYMVWTLAESNIINLSLPTFAIYPKLFVKETIDQVEWYEEFLIDKNGFDINDMRFENTSTFLKMYYEMNVVFFGGLWNIRNGLKIFHDETISIHMITEIQCVNKSFVDIGVAYIIAGSPYTVGKGTDIDRISIITGAETSTLFVDEEIDIAATYSFYELNATISAKDHSCTNFDISDMFDAGLVNPIIRIKRQNIFGVTHEAVVMGMDGYGALAEGEWILIDPTVTKDQTIDIDGDKTFGGVSSRWTYNALSANDSSYQYYASREAGNITVWKCSLTGTPTWTRIASKAHGQSWITGVACAYRENTDNLYVVWGHGDTRTLDGHTLFFWGSISNPSSGTDKSWVGWYDIGVTMNDGYYFDNYPTWSAGKQAEVGTPHWKEDVSGNDILWWPISRRHASGAWANGAGWMVKCKIDDENTNLETDGTWSLPLYTGRANQRGAQSFSKGSWDGEPFYNCGEYTNLGTGYKYRIRLWKGNVIDATSFIDKSSTSWENLLRGDIVKGVNDQELYIIAGYGWYLDHSSYPNRWNSTDDGDSWNSDNSTNIPDEITMYDYNSGGFPVVWGDCVAIGNQHGADGYVAKMTLWNMSSDTYDTPINISDRLNPTYAQTPVATFCQIDSKTIVIVHWDDDSEAWLGYTILTYNDAPTAAYYSGADAIQYGGKSYSFNTRHSDADGQGDIQYAYGGIGSNAQDIMLRCDPNEGASPTVTVTYGSGYIVGTPTSSRSSVNSSAWEITWTYVIDWDWTHDDLSDIDYYANTTDDASVSGYSSSNQNADYENELIVYSLAFYLNSTAYAEDGNLGLTADEWFRGGAGINATGVVTYEGTTNVYPPTTACDVELSTDGSLRGEDYDDDELGASGQFTTPYWPTTTASGLDAVYDLNVTLTDFVSGASQGSGGASSINVKRDNEAPTTTFTSVAEDPASDYLYISDQTVYFSDLMSSTDVFINITVTASDGSGAGVYAVQFGNTTWDDDAPLNDTASPYSRQYSIDSSESSGLIHIYTWDNVGNRDNTITITLTEDTTDPTITWLAAQTNESSDYLYYDSSSQYGYYSDNMGASTNNFYVGGTAFDGPDNLDNQNFELGDDGSWTLYQADITTSAARVHSGTWGCSTAYYSGGLYYDGYIEQSCSIPVDEIVDFTIWVKDYGTNWHIVTLYYTDETSDTQQFNTDQGDWVQVTVTIGDAGKTIEKIKIESDRTGGSSNQMSAIDDINLTVSIGSGLYSILDNTSFGNNPSNGGTNASWSFQYQIDQDDDSSGSFNVTYTVTDLVGNNGTDWFYFYLDNTNPTITWLTSQTNESSVYLYYDSSSQYGYYSDNMGVTLTDFNVGGSASDADSGVIVLVDDNTTFGNDPSNGGSNYTWSFAYSIDQDDDSSGSFNITFTASDALMNNVTDWFYFYLDNTNPLAYWLASQTNESSSYLYYDDSSQWGYYSDNMGVSLHDFNVGGNWTDVGAGIYTAIDNTSFGNNPSVSSGVLLWSFIYSVDQDDDSGGSFNITFTISDNCYNNATVWFYFYLDNTDPSVSVTWNFNTNDYAIKSGSDYGWTDIDYTSVQDTGSGLDCVRLNLYDHSASIWKTHRSIAEGLNGDTGDKSYLNQYRYYTDTGETTGTYLDDEYDNTNDRYYAFAVDMVGNLGFAQIYVRLDRTPPDSFTLVMASGPFYADITNDSTPLITISGEDDHGGSGLHATPYYFQWRVDGGEWTGSGYLASNTWSPSTGESNDVDFSGGVRDAVGNVGTFVSDSDNTVDLTDPIIELDPLTVYENSSYLYQGNELGMALDYAIVNGSWGLDGWSWEEGTSDYDEDAGIHSQDYSGGEFNFGLNSGTTWARFGWNVPSDSVLDTKIYKYLLFTVKVNSSIKIRVLWDGSGSYDLVPAFTFSSTEYTRYMFDLSQDSDWTAGHTNLQFWFYDEAWTEFEGDEFVWFKSIKLLTDEGLTDYFIDDGSWGADGMSFLDGIEGVGAYYACYRTQVNGTYLNVTTNTDGDWHGGVVLANDPIIDTTFYDYIVIRIRALDPNTVNFYLNFQGYYTSYQSLTQEWQIFMIPTPYSGLFNFGDIMLHYWNATGAWYSEQGDGILIDYFRLVHVPSGYTLSASDLSSTIGYYSDVIAEDQEVWIDFNEGTGTHVYDSSPNERTIIETSWSTDDWSTSSYWLSAGSTYHFDGSADRFYAVLDGEGAETHGHTLLAWLKSDLMSGTDTFYGLYDITVPAWTIYSYIDGNSAIHTKIQTTSAIYEFITANGIATFTNWNFVVVTWTGDVDDSPLLYINGLLISWSTEPTMSGSVYDVDRFYVGGTGGSFLDGYIDDAMCYSRVLTASEIEQFYYGMNYFYIGGEAYDDLSGLYSITDNTTFGGDPINIGSLGNWQFVYSVTFDDNGTVMVTYTATDCAGNTATYTWNTFEEDTTDPNIDWLTSQTNESSIYLWYDYIDDEQWGYYSDNMGGTPATYNVGGSASDTDSGLAIISDNTTFGNDPSYTGSLSLWTFAYAIDSGDSASGSFNITITATDNVGNTNTTWFYFYVDNTAPSISVTWNFNANDWFIISGSDYWFGDIDITNVNDSEAGLRDIILDIWNGTHVNTYRYIDSVMNGNNTALSYLDEYCYATDNCESGGTYLADVYTSSYMYIRVKAWDELSNGNDTARYCRLDRTPPDSYSIVMESGYFYASITNDSTPLLTESGATDNGGSGLHATAYYFGVNTNNGTGWIYSGWQASSTWTPVISASSNDVDFAVRVRDVVGNWGSYTYDSNNIIDLTDPSFTNIGGSEASSYLYAPSSTTDYGYYSDNMGVTLTDFNVIGAVTDNYNLEKANGSTQFSDTPQDTSITGASDSFSCTYTINNGDLGTGDVTVTIYLFDQAGNVVIDTFTFYEDNTAPSISVTWNFNANDFFIYNGSDWGFLDIDVTSVQDTGAGLGTLAIQTLGDNPSGTYRTIASLSGDTGEKQYLNEYWFATTTGEAGGTYIDEVYTIDTLRIYFDGRDMVYNWYSTSRFVRLDMTAPVIEIDPINIYENSSYLYHPNELGLARDFATDNGSWGLDGWSWEEGTDDGFSATYNEIITDGYFSSWTGIWTGYVYVTDDVTLGIIESDINYFMIRMRANVSTYLYCYLWQSNGNYEYRGFDLPDTSWHTFVYPISTFTQGLGTVDIINKLYGYNAEAAAQIDIDYIRLLTNEGFSDYWIDDGIDGADGKSFLEGIDRALDNYGSYRTQVDNTYLNVTTATGGAGGGFWAGGVQWAEEYVNCSYYNYFVVRIKALGDTENFFIRIGGSYTSGQALTSEFQIFVLPNPRSDTGAFTMALHYWNDTYIYSNIGEGVMIDYFRLIHVPTGYIPTASDFENTYGYFSDQIAEDQELWLKFDEGTGSDTYDSSPEERTIYEVGATPPVFYDSSYWLSSGSCMYFDGISSHIFPAFSNDFKLSPSYTSQMTFSFWANINSSDAAGYTFSRPWNGNGRYNYRISYDATDFYVALQPTVDPWTSTAIARPLDDQWHFYTFILDTNGTVKVYIDGEIVYSGTHDVVDWGAGEGGDSNLPLSLMTLYPYGGSWSGNTGFSLEGYLDDFMVYSRILTEYEIQHLYSGMNNFYIGGFAYDLGGLSSITDNTTIGGDPLMLGSLGNWYFAYAIENGDSSSGNWTVVYNVTDIAGNWALCNFTFIEDNTAPSGYTDTFGRHTGYGDGWYVYKDGTTIYFNSGENDYFTVQVNNDGSDISSGFNRVELDYNGVFELIVQYYSLPYNRWHYFYSDSDGIFTWRVYDNVGNYQEVNYTATGDTADPTCSVSNLDESSDFIHTSGTTTIWYGDGEGLTFSHTLTITVTSTDSISGVYAVNFPLYFNEAAVNDTSSPYSEGYGIGNLDTDTGTLTITAYDQVGNSLTDTITVYRDITNPASTFTSLTEDSVYLYWNSSTEILWISDAMGDIVQYFTINVTSADQGSNPSGNYAVQYLNTTWGDNNAYNDTSSPYSHQFEVTQNEGNISIFILAVDNVGNWEMTIEIVIIDEGSGPNVELGVGVDTIVESSDYLYAPDNTTFWYGDEMQTVDQSMTMNMIYTYNGSVGISHVNLSIAWLGSNPSDSTVPYSLTIDTIDKDDTQTGTMYVMIWTNTGQSANDTVTVYRDTTNPATPSWHRSDGVFSSGYYNVSYADIWLTGISDAGCGLLNSGAIRFYSNRGHDTGLQNNTYYNVTGWVDENYITWNWDIKDNVGNTKTQSLAYAMMFDFTDPTIDTIIPSESSVYLYYSGSGTTAYYGSNMDSALNFVFSGTVNDTGYSSPDLWLINGSSAFGDTPSDNNFQYEPTGTFSLTYTIESSDNGNQDIIITLFDRFGNYVTYDFSFIEDNTEPIITWLAAQTNESSIYLYHDGSNQYGYYSDNMGTTLTDFNVGGSASDADSGVIVLVDDNTTFGNDPSNGGSNYTWSFAYSIDQDDDTSGSFNITFTASDALMNNATTTFEFRLDNTDPIITWLASQTNESSIYLYYDDSSQYGYYGSEMSTITQDYYIGGSANDTLSGIYLVTDNTTFGNDPSNNTYSSFVLNPLWSFKYEIDIVDNGGFNVTFAVYDNCNNTAGMTTWFFFYEDNTAPTITWTWINDTDSNADGYTPLQYWDDDGVISLNATAFSDADAGLPTNYIVSRLDNETYGVNGTNTWLNRTIAIDGTWIGYVRIVDNVGNIKIESQTFYVDRVLPVINYLDWNSDVEPNYFNQLITAWATGTIGFTELNPYAAYYNTAPALTCYNDSSPGASTVFVNISINGQADGTFTLSIDLVDNAGNIDNTFPFGTQFILEAGILAVDHENWVYFKYYRADSAEYLLWQSFNTSVIIDEDYSDPNAVFIYQNRYWINDTSSIRIITRDIFGDVISNYSTTIPVLRGIATALDVYTLKIQNLYSEVINITVTKFGSVSGIILTDHVLFEEVESYDLFSGYYNITGYENDTESLVIDQDGNYLNTTYQINLTVCDYAVFIDAELVLRSFQMLISDMWELSIVTNKDHRTTLPSIYIYLNGTLQGSSPYDPGTILLPRPVASIYNITIYIIYFSLSLTYQRTLTIDSNAEVNNWHISGLSQASTQISVIWNTNKGTGILSIYDNTSLILVSSNEGEYLFTKSTTIGIHLLQLNVSVETKVYTFYANYTIPDWTAIIVLSLVGETDNYVPVNNIENYEVLVTVTRSDGGVFNGQIKINTSRSVLITAGSGSFTIRSESVRRLVWAVTSVEDELARDREYIANDLAVIFDKLLISVEASINLAYEGDTILFLVNITSMYSRTVPSQYSYNVYVNEGYRTSGTIPTFELTFDEEGVYIIRVGDAADLTHDVGESKGGYVGEIEILKRVITPEQQYRSLTSILFYLLLFGVIIVLGYILVRRYRENRRIEDVRNIESRILSDKTPMVQSLKNRRTRTSGKKKRRTRRRKK